MIVSGMGQLVCDFQAASILQVRTDSFSYQNDRVHPEPLKALQVWILGERVK